MGREGSSLKPRVLHSLYRAHPAQGVVAPGGWLFCPESRQLPLAVEGACAEPPTKPPSRGKEGIARSKSGAGSWEQRASP